MTTLSITRTHPAAHLPTRAHPTDAGLDLRALEPATVAPGGTTTVRTGITVGIPEGHVGLVWPRSGLARHGVDTLAGVIDHGYTGEVQVVLTTHGQTHHHIEPGDRVAQLLITPIATPEPVLVEYLDDTARGDGAFGSTGVA